MPKFIDLTGQTINSIYVIERAQDKYTISGHLRVMWSCKCLACGKTFIADGQNLRKRNIISCGCLGVKHRAIASHKKRKDLTGNIYNYLLVNGPAEDHVKPNGKHVAMWDCTCLRCGNKTITSGENLKNGKAKSCGCIKKEFLGEKTFKSLVGQTFSCLYVESRAPNKYLPNGTPVVMYNCICSCGEKIVVSGNNLRSKNTKSCGHLGASFGEHIIKEVLVKENINYKRDSGFKDLQTSRGGYPRFDFKIFDNLNKLLCVVEIQGLQHYKERKNSDFGKFQREETDKLKKDYCFAHNIPLYEIKYDEDYTQRIYEILNKINVLQANPVPSSNYREG